jgi:hypothetical protein
MHHHRNDGTEPAPRHANTPPRLGRVHGLGYVDFLRIDLASVQLPWLVDEIDTLRGCVEEEIARQLAGYDEPPGDAEQNGQSHANDVKRELDRLAYKLQVLAMIRAQLRLKGDVATDSEIGEQAPSGSHSAPGSDPAHERFAVVGPAAVMTVLIKGAARNVADALGEGLRDPLGDQRGLHGKGSRGAALPRLSPEAATGLRTTADASREFTTIYLELALLQTYRFDPEYEPTGFAELE